MYRIHKFVYYCDYGCKKYLLSPSGMEKHERHCSLNPNRICRMRTRTKARALGASSLKPGRIIGKGGTTAGT